MMLSFLCFPISCISCSEMSRFHFIALHSKENFGDGTAREVKLLYKSRNCLKDIVDCDYAFFETVGGSQLRLTSQDHHTYNHRKNNVDSGIIAKLYMCRLL